MENDQPDQHWHPFEKGKTLGKKGSEGGLILTDLENVHGARIIVEQLDEPNPRFAITFGIYGLLFHTHFKQHLDEAEKCVTWVRSTTKKVFDMYELPEDHRDEEWYTEHDRLVHELTID